ncbi:MAG: penicillin-binding protein activator [Acidocella sp.]|nr:penicillin-binding protein activator [Acidocella sp.]
MTGKTSGNVLLLVPLSGNLAPVGQALENAAKLAFPANSSPSLDIRDTGGTPAGAATAAQAGIAAGDGIILGPLTAAETQAVAPVAKAAGVNVLAFTNDGTQAAPGVWPLGITPAQQVQRVLQAAADAGRTQLAALLPDTDFGHRLADAINAQTAALSEPSAQITYYQPGFESVNLAVQNLSNFSARGQGIQNQIKRARDLGTAAGRQEANRLRHQQIPPPSFNALFIGATDANTLAEMANFLPYYDVSPPQVQFLGPALWATLAPAMAHQSVLLGALYAAPDPAASAAFDAKYLAAYGTSPPAIADVAFDAAAMAKLAAGAGGYTGAVLTAPAGFTGTDGVLVLNQDGTVRRGLAVFQIAPGAPTISSPAPATLTAPAN